MPFNCGEMAPVASPALSHPAQPMVPSPREPQPIRHLKRSAAALALAVLAACGAPFEAKPDCDSADASCAGNADELTESGGATAGRATAVKGGTTSSQSGATHEGGAPSEAGVGGDATSLAGASGGAVALPVSCADALKHDPNLLSGLLTIDPDGAGPLDSFDAHCDMTSDGGGWTKIGVGEYWQKNDLQLASDSVLPWAELTALLEASTHLFRAGDGDTRLYVRDAAPLIEKVNDPAGTNSPQPWLWRSNAASVECATNYAAITSSSMLKVTTKAVSCEPLGFGEHTCGVAAGWILFHRNDTANWSGKNPCGLKMITGGTPATPTSSGLISLWLR